MPASARLWLAAVVFGGMPAAGQLAPLFQPPLQLSGPAASFEDNPAGVAISADGSRVILGHPLALCADHNHFCGSALIFIHGDGGWTLESELSDPSPLSGGQDFGSSVALAGDGSTALVGDLAKGTVQAWSRQGGSWALDIELTTPARCSYARIGTTVALSRDGNVAMLGSQDGEVYVARRAAGTWGPLSSVRGVCSPLDLLTDLAASAAGDRMVVSTIGVDGVHVDVFRADGTGWVEQAGLPLPGVGSVVAVTMSGAGDVLALGALNRNCTGGGAGCPGLADIFEWSGSAWQLTSQLVPSDPQVLGDFGFSLSLAGDGNSLLASAPSAPGPNPESGAVYVFVRRAGAWVEQQRVGPGAPASSNLFGEALALSADASTAVITDLSPGSAWILAAAPAPSIPTLGSSGLMAAGALTALAGMAIVRKRRWR